MKKLIFTTILIVSIFSIPAFGQFNLDFSAGINNSFNSFENVTGFSPESRVGYFIGVAPNYQVLNQLHIGVDFQYSRRAFGVEGNGLLSTFYRFNYFDFIPEINFDITRFLTLGIGLKYSVKLKEEFQFDGEEFREALSELEIANSTDFGITSKVSANYKNVFIFLRYVFGIKENNSGITFTDIAGASIGTLNFNNRSLQVGVGYHLDFNSENK